MHLLMKLRWRRADVADVAGVAGLFHGWSQWLVEQVSLLLCFIAWLAVDCQTTSLLRLQNAHELQQWAQQRQQQQEK